MVQTNEDYKLKQIPEDFIVREVFTPKVTGSGPYCYYRLTKKLMTTQAAIGAASRLLQVSPAYINFSGNKDKEAVTEQCISVRNGPEKSFSYGGLALEFLGRGLERLSLGCASQNEFEIVIRNIEKRPAKIKSFPNYYDSQRFGFSGHNHEIGKLILQRRFAEAALRIPELASRPGTPLEKLRSLPKDTLRLYPHSYQSFLWNKMAEEYLKKNPKPPEGLEVPIIGWDTVLRPPFREAGQKLLASEDLRRHDFKIAELPECNLEGGSRLLMAAPENLEIGPLQKDELNPGKRKCRVKFALAGGCYATMCVKAMMSS